MVYCLVWRSTFRNRNVIFFITTFCAIGTELAIIYFFNFFYKLFILYEPSRLVYNDLSRIFSLPFINVFIAYWQCKTNNIGFCIYLFRMKKKKIFLYFKYIFLHCSERWIRNHYFCSVLRFLKLKSLPTYWRVIGKVVNFVHNTNAQLFNRPSCPCIIL